MQPLPAPCPADLSPDATGMAAFEAAYRQAKEQDAVIVASSVCASTGRRGQT